MQNKNSEIVEGFKGQALNYVIIVKEISNENTTDFGFDKSGIVDKNEKFKKGVVVSIGPSCPRNEEHSIWEGDEVLYDGYKASPLSLNGVEYKTLLFGDLVMAF